MIGMSLNCVLWFARSIFVLLHDGTSHALLVGHGRSQGEKEFWGLAPRKT